MPSGTLLVVATPIGNLADSSPRALDALRTAHVIACEDTRTTQTLLARHGITTRTVALHQHNERGAAAKLVALLLEGKTVAVVSDAGTPGVSDPGALLVEQAHRAGVPVSPLPGPSAAAAAVSASGFPAERFLFAGFLPATASARRKALQALDLPYPVVIYEAPHRIAAAVADLRERFGDEREIVVCRELTKKFEEVARLALGAVPDWLAQPHRQQGEFVLVLSPGGAPQAAIDADRVLSLLLEALSPADAAKIAARITGVPRNELYRRALERAK